MSQTSQALYRRSADVDTSAVGERVIVFERASKSAIVLNPTGACLWKLLEVPRSSAQLSAALQEQFPAAAPEQISADVEHYLSELSDQKLVARD